MGLEEDIKENLVAIVQVQNIGERKRDSCVIRSENELKGSDGRVTNFSQGFSSR